MPTQLTPDQARKALDALYVHGNYVARLRKRMRAVGLADDDPIYRAAIQADDALVALRMALHGRACGKE